MIWIWGPSGIGKTTIARFLFNQISSHFQNSAFMKDIKGSYPKPCFDEYNAKLQLQNKMLSKMINQKDIMIPHLGVAQERLRDRKVFLVPDDVDRLAQLHALAGNVQWFGPGSRIIITTEDLRLLKAIGIDHIYKVNFPSTDEALQMFCMYAFHQKSPKDGLDELAREITYLVGELPLGLKVMGSYFCGLSKEQWSVEVSRLRTNINGDIESILKFSYDALCDEDKDLFLHIACFFNNQRIWTVEQILAERFKDLSQRLYVLRMKSLISIEGIYELKMHNLLVQLGKEIVRKEFVRDPGQRQFLIDYKDICQVLTCYTTMSTGSVVGIDSKYGLNINEKAFEGMFNLEFLRVRSKYDVDHQKITSSRGPLTFISPKLRLLDWYKFPMTCLCFTNNLEFLVELSMHSSKLEKLWDGTKLLRNLKWMDLSYSLNLKELPNLSTATNLKELYLRNCPSLVSLPQLPDSLIELDAEDCESLEKLDCSFCNPGIRLNFVNCFNLNEEARDIIIQTSTLKCVVLPGKEVPACFTYRASGSSVTVKLNQKPLPTSTKFKACILLVNEDEASNFGRNSMNVLCSITSKQNGLTARRSYNRNLYPIITENLYIFDFEAEAVTSTELVFTFELRSSVALGTWEIKECGILSTLGASC